MVVKSMQKTSSSHRIELLCMGVQILLGHINCPWHSYIYFSQKSWMDAATWLHEKFVPYVKRFCEENSVEYKILLILDNALAHPSTDMLTSLDGRVTARSLPPTTSIAQPMDQGVLKALKRHHQWTA